MSKLIAASHLSHVAEVIFGELQLKSFCHAVAYELPTQTRHELVVFLVNRHFRFSLMLLLQIGFQHLVGQREFTGGLHQAFAGVDGETIAGVGSKLSGNHLAQLLFVFLIVVHLVFAEYLVVVFLTRLSAAQHNDFRNIHAEVGVHVGGFLFAYVEHRREFHRIAGASVPRVEVDGSAHVLAHEQVFLSLIGEVFGSNDAHGHLDAVGHRVAFSVELRQRAFHQRVGLYRVAFLLLAVTAAQNLVLTLHHVVGNFYLVGRYFYLLNIDVDFRSQTKFEFEHHFIGVEVGYRVGVRHGVAKYGQLLFADVFKEFVRDAFVDNVIAHCFAVFLLEHAHGGVARTETRFVACARQFLHLLLYLLLEVLLGCLNGYKSVDFVDFCVCYVHGRVLYVVYIPACIMPSGFSKIPRKVSQFRQLKQIFGQHSLANC